MDKKAILITVICSIVLAAGILALFAIAASKNNHTKNNFKNTEAAQKPQSSENTEKPENTEKTETASEASSAGDDQTVSQYYPECPRIERLDYLYSKEQYGVVLKEYDKEKKWYVYILGKDSEKASSILKGYLEKLKSNMGMKYEKLDNTEVPRYHITRNSKNIALIGYARLIDYDYNYAITINFFEDAINFERLPYSKREYESMLSDIISEKNPIDLLLEGATSKYDNYKHSCRSIKNFKVTTIECTKYDEDRKYAEVTAKGSYTAYDEYGSLMGVYIFDAVFQTENDGKEISYYFPKVNVWKR